MEKIEKLEKERKLKSIFSLILGIITIGLIVFDMNSERKMYAWLLSFGLFLVQALQAFIIVPKEIRNVKKGKK